MTLYRLRIEILSAFVTPLKGDTIWGHIVWGIANHEGDDAVNEFLRQEKEQPVLVVSSAFPAGMVCIDLPAVKTRDGRLTLKGYVDIKKEKKKRYKSASKFFKNMEAPDNEETTNPLKGVTVMHNAIDRSINTSMELFSTEEKWPGKYNEWDIYVLSTLESGRIRELFEWAFENGYGADASTGKGRIEVIKGDNPVKVEPKFENGTRYMALGPFVEEKELGNLRADIFIRSGKIGGAFAGSMTPYKKQAVLYDEGAVFTGNAGIKYVGVLLEKMHEDNDKNICQSGFAPVIPIGA